MAVNPLLLFDSFPSCVEPDIGVGYHVGLLLGLPNLSVVVPGEVVTPPCVLGLGTQCAGHHCGIFHYEFLRRPRHRF